MFWDNSNKHQGEGSKSLRRAMSIIKLNPNIDPSTWDHTEEERYGLGKVRSVELFFKLFLIDTTAQRSVQLCPFVDKGAMHHNFLKYLRPDGLGIDYSYLENFDTSDLIYAGFEDKRLAAEGKLREAMRAKKLSLIQYHLTEALRVGLERQKPEFIAQVQAMIKSLSR